MAVTAAVAALEIAAVDKVTAAVVSSESSPAIVTVTVAYISLINSKFKKVRENVYTTHGLTVAASADCVVAGAAEDTLAAL